ncbi:MAG: site-specific DNA-methyltransferase, partial [Selenomonadaceae bacterium]|nr:site-specific DNA-methyltransferase [Selenomonadaceae bacterium]
LPRYKNLVRCIYIDPPYNTGAVFEHYNDNFEHATWLNFMYPRLEMLREFLSDDGAIFISIDDNEQAYLKIICDEIFGRNNFVASLPWQSRQSLQNDTDFSINHEFIVVYAKKRRMKDRRLKPSNADRWHSIKEFAFNPLPVDESKFSNPDNDSRGAWKADPFDAPNIRPNLTYPITNPNTGEKFLPPEGRHWRTTPENFSALLADGRIIFGKTGKTKPQLKVFLSEQQSLGSVANSWFDAENYGTATEGTKLLQKIFGDKNIFDFPKPPRLIEKILRLATEKNSIVMDAFAGSGTTAHAVINLNATDGGNRKFILIEEKNYCETITAERVKRVGGEFKFARLGEKLFTASGAINPQVTSEELAAHIWFNRTGTALTEKFSLPLIGIHDGAAIYLIENILTEKIFATLPNHDGQKIIYGAACRLSNSFLRTNKIIFKQLPTDIGG